MMFRKTMPAQVNALGDDEVEVILSTAALARDGHILIPQGCDLTAYRQNPIVLWQHDPEHPVGTCEDIAVSADNITARIRFAPSGVAQKADETRGLVKSGVVRSVSVGFDAVDGEPLDPKKPRGGYRFTHWELFEVSFVSVPADPGAVVTARANENGERPVMTKKAKARAKPMAAPKFRGMYDVANLAWLISQLGYIKSDADYEKALEEDDSAVPDMLGEALVQLGESLIAMTKEEVGELLDRLSVEVVDEETEILIIDEATRTHIAAAPNARAKSVRRAFARAKQRAGKTLSDETVRCLRDALSDHEEGMSCARSAMRAHKSAAGKITDMMDRAGVPAEEDEDDQTVQTSAGTETSTGSEGGRSADYRRRQADKLALSVH